jgi:hypothetical protein
MFNRREFELVAADTNSIAINRIHLIVIESADKNRTNNNQTEVIYLQGPSFDSYSSTGAVENERNIWIHPIRNGFFNCLETAPFPYVKFPARPGLTWSDQMAIGQSWGDELWGTWKGKLHLTYQYTSTAMTTITIMNESLDCLITESSARSELGETTLTSYYSPTHGFVRLEYVLLNSLKVNLWLVDFKTGQVFNDPETIFKTKDYIKR